MSTAKPFKLTRTQLQSLQSFRNHFGPEWKSRLRAFWMQGAPLDEWPGVYKLRNTHGLRWLFEFDLDAEAEVEEVIS